MENVTEVKLFKHQTHLCIITEEEILLESKSRIKEVFKFSCTSGGEASNEIEMRDKQVQNS